MTASDPTFAQTFLTPAVLITVLVCLVLAALGIWLALWLERRSRARALAQQRAHQETTVDRLLASFGQDKDELLHEHEALLAERDGRIATLEAENARLRDRLTSSGLMGLFGNNKRDVVSALLLENEQLHELLVQKQEQMRDLANDMTRQLLDRLDEQAQESARAVRYKQALLSAFLQQQEARQLLDRMISDGQVQAPPPQAQTTTAQEPDEG